MLISISKDMREKKVRVGREKKEEEGDRMSIRKLGR